jgi:hypothetical protein
VTREHSSPTNPIDKREYITLHAADEPSPECLAAFNEFLDAFGSLTPEQQAIAASAARQWALDSEQRQALKRQRKPRRKTIIDQAKKAGANSITTPDGVTYRFEAEQQTDTDRESTADDELERWRRKHAR